MAKKKPQQKPSNLRYVWIGILILMLAVLVLPLFIDAFAGAM